MAKNPWTATGWEFVPDNLNDLTNAVNRLGTSNISRRYVWRGMRSTSYELEPSLVRSMRDSGKPHSEEHVREQERALVAEARKWPAPEFAGLPPDQYVLALLQHYGVPTALLDVTTDPMTALWFACEVKPEDSRNFAGVLLAFDVTEWETLRTEPAQATFATLNPSSEYKTQIDSGKPFLIDPSRPSGRMAAQRGKLLRAPISSVKPFGVEIPGVTGVRPDFDIQEELSRKVERGYPKRIPFVAFRVTPAIKGKLRPHIKGTYGINRSVLFPEIVGFGDAVRNGEIG